MTVKELIELLQNYPDQDREVKICHFEDGPVGLLGLKDQRYYVGCTHYPKFDKKTGFPIPNSGTYEHNSSCQLEVAHVELEY